MAQMNSYCNLMGFKANLFMSIGGIYFRTNDRALDRQDKEVLRKLATVFEYKAVMGEKIEITLLGTSDPQGKSLYNQWLSQKRIGAVVRELWAQMGSQTSGKLVAWCVGLGERTGVGVHGSSKTEVNPNRRSVLLYWGRFDKTILSGLDAQEFEGEDKVRRFEVREGKVLISDGAELRRDVKMPVMSR